MISVHKSWKDLKPHKDEDGNIECFDDYYSRIKNKLGCENFPLEVFEQWIHPHHNNDETLKNYSWIDFENIQFELVEWEFDSLKDLHIIDDYREYVESKSTYKDLRSFTCVDRDLKFWEEKGTWRTPPIIIDVKAFLKDNPKWSELEKDYQLVEGHSRLGYLKSIKRIDETIIAKKHKVFLLKKL
jgi:hypothetical protein